MGNALVTKSNEAQANTILVAELKVNDCRLFHTWEHCQRWREWVGEVTVDETDEWTIFMIMKCMEA